MGEVLPSEDVARPGPPHAHRQLKAVRHVVGVDEVGASWRIRPHQRRRRPAAPPRRCSRRFRTLPRRRWGCRRRPGGHPSRRAPAPRRLACSPRRRAALRGRVFLGRRPVQRAVTDGDAGGDVHQPAHPGTAGGLQDLPRALDVDGHQQQSARLVEPDVPGGVEHPVDAGHRLGQGVCIAHVPRHPLHVQPTEGTGIRARREQHARSFPTPEEGPDQVCSDESSGARQERSHGIDACPSKPAPTRGVNR
jgi:hypothetical protein